MKTVATPPSVPEINLALVAQNKRQAGQRISKKEKKAIDRFRDLYKDAAEISSTPGLQSALLGAVKSQSSNIVKVAANPLLTQHLEQIQKKGSASDAEIAQIRQLAGKLSEDEDDAISATLAQLSLTGGASATAISQVSQFLDTERAARKSYVTTRKVTGRLAQGGLAVGLAVAAPLLVWFTPLAAGAAAVKLATVAGGLVSGGAIGSFINNRLNKGANSYGVAD